MAVRLTRSNGDTLAIPEQAMMTAEIDDIVRPTQAAKFMGSSILTAGTPKLLATFGARVAKDSSEYFSTDNQADDRTKYRAHTIQKLVKTSQGFFDVTGTDQFEDHAHKYRDQHSRNQFHTDRGDQHFGEYQQQYEWNHRQQGINARSLGLVFCFLVSSSFAPTCSAAT